MKTRIFSPLSVGTGLAGLALVFYLFPADVAAGPAPPPPPCGTGTDLLALGVIIASPGLYCVTSDLPAPAVDQDGITITASGVVLDLGGHTLTSGGGDSSAIVITGDRVTVRNGRLLNWVTAGISGGSGQQHRIQDLEVSGCGIGVEVGRLSVVENVLSITNTEAGFVAGPDSVFRDCRSESNDRGYDTETGVLLEHCSAVDNAGPGFVGDLMTTIESCRSRDNDGGGFVISGGYSVIRGSAAFDNEGSGFIVGDHSSIIDCRTVISGQHGIVLGSFSQAIGCSVTQNASGRGIEASHQSIIERCILSSCDEGIFVSNNCQVLDTIVHNTTGPAIRAIKPVARVEGCLLEHNFGDGISVLGSSQVLNNLVANSTNAAVHVEGAATRVEGNSLSGNAVGIRVVGQDNLIIGNDLASHPIPFDIPNGNTRGSHGTSSNYIQSNSPYTNFNLTFPF